MLGVKKSMIDFAIISRDLVEHLKKIHIDDEYLNLMTNNLKPKTIVDYSESDHNLIHTIFKLMWTPGQRYSIP